MILNYALWNTYSVQESALATLAMQSLKTTSKRQAALALAPVLIVFSMGQTVLFAVAGPVFRDVGLSEFQLGLIVSVSAVMFVVVSPIWGRLSDRFSRKSVIVFGLFTYSIISLAFAATMDLGLRGMMASTLVFWTLLSLRLLYAALGAGIQPASVALMSDLSDATDRSSSVAIIGASFGFGMILGPATAAALVGWGVLTPLYAIAILGFLCVLIAAVFLPNVRVDIREQAKTSGINYRRLMPVMVIALLLFTAVSGLQQTIAFYVQDFLQADAQAAARMTGFCFVAMATASLVVQGGLIQLLKPKPESLLKLGFPIMALGLVFYTFPTDFWQLILGCAVIGTGFGLANPGLMAVASLRTEAHAQGAAAGIIQSMMAAGYIVGPLAATGGYGLSPLITASFILICLAVAALLSLLLKPIFDMAIS